MKNLLEIGGAALILFYLLGVGNMIRTGRGFNPTDLQRYQLLVSSVAKRARGSLVKSSCVLFFFMALPTIIASIPQIPVFVAPVVLLLLWGIIGLKHIARVRMYASTTDLPLPIVDALVVHQVLFSFGFVIFFSTFLIRLSLSSTG